MFCTILLVPQQSNRCDCGVFVCMNAYAVYSLVNKKIRRNDTWFLDLKSECQAFKFQMKEIHSLRKDIMALVERLSYLYMSSMLGNNSSNT